jgi:hypothetical protein
MKFIWRTVDKDILVKLPEMPDIELPDVPSNSDWFKALYPEDYEAFSKIIEELLKE